MDNPGPHDMVSCPYNKSHQIEHYRMHIHLQKCRKQHLNCKKVTCPFDATHIVNDMELDVSTLIIYKFVKTLLFETILRGQAIWIFLLKR